MALPLKQSIAATYPIGPFTDASGSVLGSLNIIQGDIMISKAGAAFATIGGIATAYADRHGHYLVGFDTNDTDTAGGLKVSLQPATALPVWQDFAVHAANEYDALFGTGKMMVGTVAFVADGIVGSVGNVEVADVVGTVTYLLGGVIGSLGFVSNGIVGTVGHASSVATINAVGTVAHIMASGDKTGYDLNADQSAVVIGTVGHASSVPTINAVGTVAHVMAIGDKTGYDLNADQSAVVIGIVGTVTYLLGGVIGSVGFLSGGVIGSVGHVENVAGGVIGSVGYLSGGVVGTAGYVPVVGSVINVDVVGTILGIASLPRNDIADAVLKRDIDQVEVAAPVHSLTVAILKAISRIRDNAGTLEIYLTDGTTIKMEQTITTDSDNAPIDELTAGAAP